MTTASAPGKVILFGEHAVVYGRPAIAVPVWDVTATATITQQTPGSGCIVVAHDTDQILSLAHSGNEEPLAVLVRLALKHLSIRRMPDWRIDLLSTIPIVSGLGSGAAVSAAIVRALFAHTGRQVQAEVVSQLVYETEKLFHGTPSGIDNTVIAHEKPVWFVKGTQPEPFTPVGSITLVIADSGISSPTKEAVGDVRMAWQADAVRYEELFDTIGQLVTRARSVLEQTDPARQVELGSLMNQNQEILRDIGVSSSTLDHLIQAALNAGALGAKLSGGGRGGNIIALVDEQTASPVQQALKEAGAKRVIVTSVG
ncbi:mevalonate kinase [Chloroflexi bacterium TSY]|nr:mevalonate kinase [Chloroflexi bacterium TSY]